MKGIFKKVYTFWELKEPRKKLVAPFISFHTDGNVWDSFATVDAYMGATNHFLFEAVDADKEYLIDNEGGYFVMRYDERKKTIYPEFIKIIMQQELLDLVITSEINEIKEYESMNSFEEIFTGLLFERYSY